MDELMELIEKIIQCPEIYIGKRSVERLYAFISGYVCCNPESDTGWSREFTKYVATYYSITSSQNWASIIQFFSADENDAFSLFIYHFRSFQAKIMDRI